MRKKISIQNKESYSSKRIQTQSLQSQATRHFGIFRDNCHYSSKSRLQNLEIITIPALNKEINKAKVTIRIKRRENHEGTCTLQLPRMIKQLYPKGGLEAENSINGSPLKKRGNKYDSQIEQVRPPCCSKSKHALPP